MKTFFQCLGITGVILLLYGLLAFAFTQASTPFFWSLLGLGGLCTALFVWRSLSREWQAAVGALVALNAPWIGLAVGRAWPSWTIGTAGAIVVVLLFFSGIRKIRPERVAAVCVFVAVSYTALWYYRDREWYRYGILGAAFVYNGILVGWARLLFKDFVRSRSLQYGSSAVVYTAVVVAIVAAANVLSTDRHYAWDLTEGKVNKLTEQSVQVVKGLKKPVKIYAFLDARNPQKTQLKDLLQEYKYETKNLEYSFVDPDRERPLAIQYKAKDGDVAVDFEGQTNLTQTLTEEGITQAIVKVTRTANPTVCFTKGHGELDLEGADDEPRGLTAIKGGLVNEGYKPKAIDSIAGGVPEDCRIVVIAGPLQAFTQGEAEAFGEYLAGGGKTVALLDPNFPNTRLAGKSFGILDTGLEGILDKWGAELGKNVVLEKHLKLLQGVQTEPYVIAQTYGNHPIVEPLKNGRNTVFHLVRSVRKKAGFAGTAVDLISSAGEGGSWAEADIPDLIFRQNASPGGPGDIAGPVPIAVAVEKAASGEDEKAQTTRLVVFGDADFVSNGMIRSYEFNFDLFLNVLNWLQGESERITIRPKRIRSSAIELSPQQATTIFYVAIIGIPMIVLIFGINLWWWRRRRG